MDSTIQVNFNRPLPLFPLPRTILLPHAVQQLQVFEDKYCQLVEDCLDKAGQIAMATYDEGVDATNMDSHHLRAAVCVGQIIQHHRFDDGRFALLLLGICRAEITKIEEPTEGNLYKLAHLKLLEQTVANSLSGVREELRDLLEAPTLNQVRGVNKVIKLMDREDVPTQAILELIASSVVDDIETRYSLLAEPDPAHRAIMIRNELKKMDRLIRSAHWQMNGDWPKGLSWN